MLDLLLNKYFYYGMTIPATKNSTLLEVALATTASCFVFFSPDYSGLVTNYYQVTGLLTLC